MSKYKLKIAYDGTHYSGWQIQKNSRSIQSLIEEALKICLREEVALVGSGRTDAGVHAFGQIAHFVCEKPISIEKTSLSLNGLLPKDIRILCLEETPPDFHARFSAKRKIYHYRLHFPPTDPFRRHYSTQVSTSLNLLLMHQATRCFVGTHDFSSFAHEATEGAASRNPIKTIHRLDMVEEPGGVRFEFEGNGFLYKMVRNIVGTLIEVGMGKKEISSIPVILAARDRKKAGRTAPPQGLFLMEVLYGN